MVECNICANVMTRWGWRPSPCWSFLRVMSIGGFRWPKVDSLGHGLLDCSQIRGYPVSLGLCDHLLLLMTSWLICLTGCTFGYHRCQGAHAHRSRPVYVILFLQWWFNVLKHINGYKLVFCDSTWLYYEFIIYVLQHSYPLELLIGTCIWTYLMILYRCMKHYGSWHYLLEKCCGKNA